LEEHLEGFGALVAGIGAGNGDAQWVERGVSPREFAKGRLPREFSFGPLLMVDVREALGRGRRPVRGQAERRARPSGDWRGRDPPHQYAR